MERRITILSGGNGARTMAGALAYERDWRGVGIGLNALDFDGMSAEEFRGYLKTGTKQIVKGEDISQISFKSLFQHQKATHSCGVAF